MIGVAPSGRRVRCRLVSHTFDCPRSHEQGTKVLRAYDHGEHEVQKLRQSWTDR